LPCVFCIFESSFEIEWRYICPEIRVLINMYELESWI
jgi:hypothetical protein